ncbi:MAG: hypothetical protein M3Y59_03840 [Myxococcota bacterium]|nr:hypothetical protein [Myxococcota bacterium]
MSGQVAAWTPRAVAKARWQRIRCVSPLVSAPSRSRSRTPLGSSSTLSNQRVSSGQPVRASTLIP